MIFPVKVSATPPAALVRDVAYALDRYSKAIQEHGPETHMGRHFSSGTAHELPERKKMAEDSQTPCPKAQKT